MLQKQTYQYAATDPLINEQQTRGRDHCAEHLSEVNLSLKQKQPQVQSSHFSISLTEKEACNWDS